MKQHVPVLSVHAIVLTAVHIPVTTLRAQSTCVTHVPHVPLQPQPAPQAAAYRVPSLQVGIARAGVSCQEAPLVCPVPSRLLWLSMSFLRLIICFYIFLYRVSQKCAQLLVTIKLVFTETRFAFRM